MTSETRRDVLTAVIAMIVFTVLLGLVYPFFIEGASQVVFPGEANGQKIYVKGQLVGSKIIGQSFSTEVLEKNGKAREEKGAVVTEPDPRYFQSRPSGTKPAYNAAESTFTNLGPNSVKTREAFEANIKAYLELNAAPNKQPYDPGLTVAKIPVDAAGSSGSGLDPEISEANAHIQAYRIAALRRLALARVDGLIARYTSGRGLGFSGEPGVNVLELNLALDRLTGGKG
jgi:potassium-transporting ATPase KdpC subunit